MKAERQLPRTKTSTHRANLTGCPYLLLLLAALFWVAAPPAGQAQDRSPVGSWNCVISGSRNGLAYLNFSSDPEGGSFEGFEVLVPKNLPVSHAAGTNAVAGSLATSAHTGRATQSASRTSLV